MSFKKPSRKTPVIETSALQKFHSRLQYIHQHLQLMDASLSRTSEFLAQVTPGTQNISLSLGKLETTHSKLNHPSSHHVRIVSYSRSKNSEFSILELYRNFTEYMRNILGELYKKEPMKIVQIVSEDNKDNKLTFAEIVSLGTYEKISEQMVSKVFRKLENERSTQLLLEKILNHTKIKLDEKLKTEALMYLQMRHLFTHNHGRADKAFTKEFGELIKIKEGDDLPANFKTISNAVSTVSKLCETIDSSLIKADLVAARK